MNQKLIGATALMALAATSLWAAERTTAAPPSRAALERAFSFASAIETDPKDRSMAQASVALEALALDDGEQAAALADQVVGWQRGVVYAEIAAWHARAGRREAARAFLAKAEELQRTQEGWQGPRIRAHIGAVLAALGDADAARRITGELAANDRQYNGMAVVASARVLAEKGQFDAAMAEIGKTEGETDYEFALGRTSAYLELAQRPGFGRDQRMSALRAARAAAGDVPVWTRIDLLVAVSNEYRKLETEAEARETLHAAEALGRALPSTSMVRAGALSSVAQAWIALGEPARARDVLDAAAAGLEDMQAIDRPEMLARIAAVTVEVPDPDLAGRRFDQALAEAEALVNARPRALAVVGICRALARAGVVPDAPTSARLDALRRGLRAPW